jgi:hypothetical protein
MDMTASTEARSDQINAADLASGPRTYTIEKVVAGKASHPFDFLLIESPGKAYRPNLGMRRVIVAGWGPKTEAYHGRRLTIFNEPSVIYAGAEIGGIRISHMSDLEDGKPLKTSLAISQKKKVPYIVQPLAATPATPASTPEATSEQVAASTDLDQLGGMWRSSGPERRAEIEARVAVIKAAAEPDASANTDWDEATS